MAKKKYYAVQKGRVPGVYLTWDECKKQVDGFSGAAFKSFSTMEEARQFRVTRLRDFREILCAGGQYRYLGEQPQDLSVLEDCPVISLGRSTKTYEFYSQFLLSHDREWKTDIEVSTADQMLPLVRRGLGIGFIGEFFLGDALFSGEVREIPLKEPPPCRSICLVEDTSRHLSIASAKIAEILKSAAQ